jgi:hypothetical protein
VKYALKSQSAVPEIMNFVGICWSERKDSERRLILIAGLNNGDAEVPRVIGDVPNLDPRQ